MTDGLMAPIADYYDSGSAEAADEAYFGAGDVLTMPFMPGLQTTLRQPVRCSGIGLHCGRLVNLVLKPAPAGTGIRFRRLDINSDHGWIDATWANVSDTMLCTTISNEHGISIATVEHLMAALAAAGVDNVVAELDAPEPPAMDGSSQPFLFLIECAGVLALSEQRQMLRILKPVKVEEGVKSAALIPSKGSGLDVTIDFENPIIGEQRVAVSLSGMRFKSELARARTFGFAHEVAYMQSKGLALGGSLDNAVVVQDDQILNPTGLRYSDEFVRHKALDAVGDLYLAGGPFLGRYVGVQAGHKLNNLLLRALMADASAFEWTTASALIAEAAA